MPKSIFRPVNSEGGDGSGRLKKVLEECLKSSEQGFDAAKNSSMRLLSLVRQAREDLQKAINPGGELANAGEECRKKTGRTVSGQEKKEKNICGFGRNIEIETLIKEIQAENKESK